jgi:two-component system chemotaxis response regulator CheY
MTEAKKPRVLIADDEGHIRMLMKAVLTSMQYQIVGMATNGQEAVELFSKEKPDLLLLDINMPLKTGEEALREIMDAFPDAFVIMLTSVADRGSVENCISLGAIHYIRKDTPITEMKAIIQETWQRFLEEKEAPHA